MLDNLFSFLGFLAGMAIYPLAGVISVVVGGYSFDLVRRASNHLWSGCLSALALPIFSIAVVIKWFLPPSGGLIAVLILERNGLSGNNSLTAGIAMASVISFSVVLKRVATFDFDHPDQNIVYMKNFPRLLGEYDEKKKINLRSRGAWFIDRTTYHMLTVVASYAVLIWALHALQVVSRSDHANGLGIVDATRFALDQIASLGSGSIEFRSAIVDVITLIWTFTFYVFAALFVSMSMSYLDQGKRSEFNQQELESLDRKNSKSSEG